MVLPVLVEGVLRLDVLVVCLVVRELVDQRSLLRGEHRHSLVVIALLFSLAGCTMRSSLLLSSCRVVLLCRCAISHDLVVLRGEDAEEVLFCQSCSSVIVLAVVGQVHQFVLDRDPLVSVGLHYLGVLPGVHGFGESWFLRSVVFGGVRVARVVVFELWSSSLVLFLGPCILHVEASDVFGLASKGFNEAAFHPLLDINALDSL